VITASARRGLHSEFADELGASRMRTISHRRHLSAERKRARQPASRSGTNACQRSSYSPSCRSRAPPGRQGTNRRRDDGRGSPRLARDASRACDPGGRYTEVLPRRPPATLPSTSVAGTRLTRLDAHLPDVSSGPSRYGRSRQRPRVNSPRPSTVMRESGCRPPVTRSCNGRRPQGESRDRSQRPRRRFSDG
jgi:hypothetical protein